MVHRRCVSANAVAREETQRVRVESIEQFGRVPVDRDRAFVLELEPAEAARLEGDARQPCTLRRLDVLWW